ncbi:MAG: isopentenyl-diphosphate Delta-isomerase [Bacteroidales bacterium]|nr:isopentenyl-diphosphate Delta-isomerase [Bacteroidales bacterium]
MNNDSLKIALVDENDKIIGFAAKDEVHKKGFLHRAFSIFVFNSKNQLLLQKRAVSKYHSGGLLTNTCCSHLVENVDFENYMHQRLREEMGFDCELIFRFSFTYKIKFDNGLTEYETDHVYTGIWDGIPKPNPDEADGFLWMDFDEVILDVEKTPEKYTYWFREAIKKFGKY